MNQYPGTNYHDLNLNWLLQQMKACLAEWAETKEDWTDLQADNTEFKADIEREWDEFSAYLTETYLPEHISADVATKIEAMANDGSLLAIITYDSGEGSALSDTVGTWLAAHITQETGYVIDDTLTVSGAAADAKVTGDEISDLKGALMQDEAIFSDLALENYADSTITATKNNTQYFYLAEKLQADTPYCFEFEASSDVTTTVMLNRKDTLASKEAELYKNQLFSASVKMRKIYVPSVSTIQYVRVDSNAILSALALTVTKLDWDVLNDKIENANNAIESNKDVDKQNAIVTYQNQSEVTAFTKFIEDSTNAMLGVRLDTPVSKTVTINAGTHERVMVRVGLHYGSSRYTPQDDDIFFDQNSKKDFSDVRFFDADGNMLKAELGSLVHLDVLADTRINGRTTAGGKIIKFSDASGILISNDNGANFTAISGTANVTNNASDVYGYKSMCPVYTDNDDNIYAYAGGVLYKLLASDSYATKTAVCDFTWQNNGTTIYPEIQAHGMDADSNGVLFFGAYQGTQYYHVDVYKSTDNGATWSICYTKDGDTGYQHVHHVHSDPYTGKTYVGIDSSPSSALGSKIIVTSNGGTSWSDITEQIMESSDPATMKDYYPTYFGNGYRLGGGETYIAGRATIYRSTDDINLISAVQGIAGVRSFADFGNDSIIVCGSSQCNNVAENQIFVSGDKGQTWFSVYKKYQTPSDNSGIGFRQAYNAVLLTGDTEPCIVLAADQGNVPSMRIYSGGDNWYREAYILLENTSGNVTITAKTGYAMEYPYKNIESRSENNLVYHIPLSEGNGKYIHDSEGNICAINGDDFTWDKTPVTRFGDYSGKSTIRPYMPSYGIRLEQGTTVNFGKISKLNFSKNYSIALWVRTDGTYVSDFYKLFSAGNTCFYQRSINFGIIDSDAEIVGGNVSNALHSSQMVNGSYRKSNHDYYFLVLTVDNSHVCKAYLNGVVGSDRNDAAPAGKQFFTLDARDFILGSNDNNGAFYISDIRIYNKVLSATEILEMYRGWRK